jgi:hypothetical protein
MLAAFMILRQTGKLAYSSTPNGEEKPAFVLFITFYFVSLFFGLIVIVIIIIIMIYLFIYFSNLHSILMIL